MSEFQPDVIVGVGGNNAMSAAKALLALYQEPELDLAAAVADPERVPACTKAKLVLVATNFSSGAQNSPFAMLENDSGQNCSLKSIHLLPEISVTDADFTATLTADQVRTCALEILSHAARAYLDPRCTEFTAGMLTEAIAAVLGYTRYAAKGCPPARKKLHNAAALAGASYGKIGEQTPNTHRAISTQQRGVENRMAGLPPDSRRERRRPFSPMGPRIRASTMAAGFRSNLRTR